MRMMILFVVLLIGTVTIASPVENVTENVKQVGSLSSVSLPSLTSVIPSTPCQNLVDDQNVRQVVFPVCNSIHGDASLSNAIIHGLPCTCDLNNRDVKKRDDYQYAPAIGAYKLHTRGTTFNNARKICNEEGGHLAIINSAAEEQVLLDIFSRTGNMKNVSNSEEAFIGIHDLYGEDDWVTILGDSLRKHGYTKWSERWGGQPDNGGGIQHCGALMREGGMDDVNCNANFAFFCEIPEIKIPHY